MICFEIMTLLLYLFDQNVGFGSRVFPAFGKAASRVIGIDLRFFTVDRDIELRLAFDVRGKTLGRHDPYRVGIGPGYPLRNVAAFGQHDAELAQLREKHAETEERIKNETKATIRCIPVDAPAEEGVCIVSGKPSHRRVLFARSY